MLAISSVNSILLDGTKRSQEVQCVVKKRVTWEGLGSIWWPQEVRCLISLAGMLREWRKEYLKIKGKDFLEKLDGSLVWEGTGVTSISEFYCKHLYENVIFIFYTWKDY